MEPPTEPPIEPTRFDAIILGTGLQESVVAGALARAGKTVLHLDCSTFYGSHFASVDLGFFQPWAETQGGIPPDPRDPRRQPPPEQPHPREVLLPSSGSGSLYSHVSVHDWSAGVGLGSPRAYSIDLCGPRVLHCGGAAVDLLVASGASQYLEFKALEGLLTWTAQKQGLQAVAGSRSDVFQDRSLSLVEKRHLMRFLKLVADLAPLSHTTPWDTPQEASTPGPRAPPGPHPGGAHSPEPPESEASGLPPDGEQRRAPGDASTGPAGDATASPVQHPAGHESEPAGGGHESEPAGGGVFKEYEGQTMEGLLEAQKLPRSIQECILYGVADASAPSPSVTAGCAPLSAPEGLARLALYFRSIGRFGARSGLIYPAYGCGELPQAFCRIAAVKGALYVSGTDTTSASLADPAIGDLTQGLRQRRVLHRDVASLLLDKESGSVCGICTMAGQSLWAPQVLLGPSFVPEPQAWGATEASVPFQEKKDCTATSASEGPAVRPGGPPSARAEGLPGVARAVCITDRSLQEDKQYLLLSVPPLGGGPEKAETAEGGREESVAPAPPRVAVRLCQLPASCSVCPVGKFLVYASAPAWRAEDTPETLLRPALDRLLDCSWGQGTKDRAGNSASGGADTAPPTTRESTGTSLLREGLPPSGAQGQSTESAAGADTQNVRREAEARGAADSRNDPLRDSAIGEAAEEPQGPKDAEEGSAMPASGTGKPRVLWCALFTQRIRLGEEMQGQLPPGVFCCSSPDATDNFEAAVAEAQQVFAEMAPGEPFYPPKEPESMVDGEEAQEDQTLDSSVPDQS